MKTMITAAIIALFSGTAAAAGLDTGLDSPTYHPSWPQVSQRMSGQFDVNGGPDIDSRTYTPSWPQVNQSHQQRMNDPVGFNNQTDLNSPDYTPSWPQVSS